MRRPWVPPALLVGPVSTPNIMTDKETVGAQGERGKYFGVKWEIGLAKIESEQIYLPVARHLSLCSVTPA